MILPAGFDYGLSEGLQETPDWWKAKGARRADLDSDDDDDAPDVFDFGDFEDGDASDDIDDESEDDTEDNQA